MSAARARGSTGRWIVAGLVVFGAVLLLIVPATLFASGGMFLQAGAECAGGSAGGGLAGGGLTAQPAPSSLASRTIPARYLSLFRSIGAHYRVPWVILAGIGRVESNDGRSDLPGVHSGENAFGAAGPMQIGIGGVAGNVWGGAPVHPATQHLAGVGVDANGDGTASVYDPADAIAGAARYLLAHGVLSDPAAAVFAYNHQRSYVSAVLGWARSYAAGGSYVAGDSGGAGRSGGTGSGGAGGSGGTGSGGAGGSGGTSGPSCPTGVDRPGAAAPNAAARAAIAFARRQLGKPYQFSWGPGGELMLGSRVCPAQNAVAGVSTGAPGVVHGGLDLVQRCAAMRVIFYAADELGKPYQWGATGPDAFDCSGLVMMAYRSAGVYVPRTSQQQWMFGRRVSANQVMPGDLVFFAGLDGTMTAPGHVGIVIGQGLMIDAPFTGADVRIDPYAGMPGLVGFTRPEA